MSGLQRARLVVGSAYARRTADGITLQLLESLERENAGLWATLSMKRRHSAARTGRRVFGRSISACLVCLGLVYGLYSFQSIAAGSCLRRFDAALRRGAVTAGDRKSVV